MKKKKAKEFFIKILKLENGNSEIKLDTQIRVNRDLSE